MLERADDVFCLIDLALELEILAGRTGQMPVKIEALGDAIGRVARRVQLPETIVEQIYDITVVDLWEDTRQRRHVGGSGRSPDSARPRGAL